MREDGSAVDGLPTAGEVVQVQVDVEEGRERSASVRFARFGRRLSKRFRLVSSFVVGFLCFWI